MPTFKTDTRVRETSVTTGAGDYALAGAPTGYQPFSVLGANNYCPYWASDGVNYEEGIGQYVAGPARLVRTHVMKSSNGGAAVNWGAGTKNIVCGPIASLDFPRVVTKSVAGAVDVTLTQLEQRCSILILTGAITANINVIVDETPWEWFVFNSTTGAFTLTIKTAAGTGKAVTQGRRASLLCDGTNVVGISDFAELVSFAAGANFASLVNFAAGANIASAATLDLTAATGNSPRITGTTATSAVTMNTGQIALVVADGAWPLTYHATNHKLNTGGLNYTLAAGDMVLYSKDQSGVVHANIIKSDGRPLVGGKVLQVVNAVYGTPASSSSSTFADTGLTATITCSSISSKVLAIVNQTGCGKDTGNTSLQVKLQRNGIDLLNMELEGGYNGSTNPNLFGTVGGTIQDSPASVSALTYKTVFASSANVAAAYVQRSNSVSSITLMEIAP